MPMAQTVFLTGCGGQHVQINSQRSNNDPFNETTEALTKDNLKMNMKTTKTGKLRLKNRNTTLR